MLRFLPALILLQVFIAHGMSQDAPPICSDRYREQLATNPKNSMAHFRLAECFSQQKDRVRAVNEFREALRGDLQPAWIKVWAHVNLGKIFDTTGQRERALTEYKMAEITGDNTGGALDEVARYRQSPYKER